MTVGTWCIADGCCLFLDPRMENQNIHEQEKLFFLYSGAKITEKLD